MAPLVEIYLLIVFVIRRPAPIKPEGWRLLGVFASTIAGLILQPLPGGAVVLLVLLAALLTGSLTLEQSLTGYADPADWLIVAAFLIARALMKTGLARCIALFFLGRFGRSSLGISYALSFSDAVLAMV